MASWSEITEGKADMKEIFGTSDILELNMEEKLDLLMVIADEKDGLVPKMEQFQNELSVVMDQMDSDNSRVTELEMTVDSMYSDIEFLKGVAQKQDGEITSKK